MEIIRDKEFVQTFNYNARNFAYEEENGTPETRVHIQIQLIEDVPDQSDADTVLNASVEFVVVLESFIVSGYIMQNNILKNKKVVEQSELSQEDMQEIAHPLLDMVRRLTMEVSEVALDQPGVNLQF
ncbi:DUF1149 family protein [Streptococcaceae bacterium ESL0729]|nr:DUF1149 family protein [Streptococcaceae bacterium ESL0729]